MGNHDRGLRSFFAAVIAILYFTNTIDGLYGELLLALALIIISGSLMGYSLIYVLFNHSTIEEEEKLF
jgi:hypothetical protein